MSRDTQGFSKRCSNLLLLIILAFSLPFELWGWQAQDKLLATYGLSIRKKLAIASLPMSNRVVPINVDQKTNNRLSWWRGIWKGEHVVVGPLVVVAQTSDQMHNRASSRYGLRILPLRERFPVVLSSLIGSEVSQLRKRIILEKNHRVESWKMVLLYPNDYVSSLQVPVVGYCKSCGNAVNNRYTGYANVRGLTDFKLPLDSFNTVLKGLRLTASIVGVEARDKHNGDRRDSLYPRWFVCSWFIIALILSAIGLYGVAFGLGYGRGALPRLCWLIGGLACILMSWCLIHAALSILDPLQEYPHYKAEGVSTCETCNLHKIIKIKYFTDHAC